MSKGKGNSFEQKIMMRLRKEFPNMDTYRNPGSGNSYRDRGDVNFYDYLIECKHYKKLGDAELNHFWDDAVEEAKDMEKKPMLIYKENYVPIKVMFKVDDKHRVIMYFDEWIAYIREELKDE